MIEVLRYIGLIGQGSQGKNFREYYEDYEALIIRVNGKEHYVLHKRYVYYSKSGAIEEKHSKVEFSRLEELISAFVNLGIDSSLRLRWVETDPNCGYNLPKKAWEEAYAKRF